MLTNLIDHPTIKVKQHTPFASTRKKLSNPYYSWDFEIQEPDDQETYHPHGNVLMHNDLNAYVVDWEIPKQEAEAKK